MANAFALLLAVSIFVSGALGLTQEGSPIEELTCEQLDRSTCAFAVSSSGSRCVLEKRVRGGGQNVAYSCRNSGVVATSFSCEAGWIETDECVASCGLDRDTYGISSDSLLDRRFTRQLCASDCYDRCPNVVDLYANVAAGEGISLSMLCEMNNGRRELEEMNSSGDAVADTHGSPEALGRKMIENFAQSPRAAAGRKLIGFEKAFLSGSNPMGRMAANEDDAVAPSPSVA